MSSILPDLSTWNLHAFFFPEDSGKVKKSIIEANVLSNSDSFISSHLGAAYYVIKAAIYSGGNVAGYGLRAFSSSATALLNLNVHEAITIFKDDTIASCQSLMFVAAGVAVVAASIFYPAIISSLMPGQDFSETSNNLSDATSPPEVQDPQERIQLMQNMEQLQSEISSSTSQTLQLQVQLSAAKEELEKLRSDQKKLVDKLYQSQQALEISKGTNNQLREELNYSQKTVEQLNADLSTELKNWQATQDELKALTTKLKTSIKGNSNTNQTAMDLLNLLLEEMGSNKTQDPENQ